MLEEPPLLIVDRRFSRPSLDLVAAFRGAMTGHIVDSMTGRGALPPDVKPINAGRSALCGVVLTVKAQPGDNLAIHAATELIQPGDIVVVSTDGFRETAVLGDLLGGVLKNCGAAGFVTDGLVRDREGILDLDWPVFAAGVSPNSPTGVGPGTVGQPIVMSGVSIASGDILVADSDGAVIIPQALAGEAAARLPEIRAAEKAAEAKIKSGATGMSKYQAVKARGLVKFIE